MCRDDVDIIIKCKRNMKKKVLFSVLMAAMVVSQAAMLAGCAESVESQQTPGDAGVLV